MLFEAILDEPVLLHGLGQIAGIGIALSDVVIFQQDGVIGPGIPNIGSQVQGLGVCVERSRAVIALAEPSADDIVLLRPAQIGPCLGIFGSQIHRPLSGDYGLVAQPRFKQGLG